MEGVALYSYRRLSAANKEDGRGVRAGNEIAKHFAGNNVDVIIYAVEKSLDSYKFNLLHYNDRRKITLSLCNTIRERIAAEIDGGEDYFCIDSKPIEVCRFARSKRCRRMMTDNEL